MSPITVPSNTSPSPNTPTPLQPNFTENILVFAARFRMQMYELSKHTNPFTYPQLKADFTYLQTGARTIASFPTPDETHLWDGWLPKSSLVLLEGPLNSGKSRFCADLAARLTSQSTFPDGQSIHTRTPHILLITTRHHPHYHQGTTSTNVTTQKSHLHHLNRLSNYQPIVTDHYSKEESVHSLYGFTFSSEDLNRLTDWLNMYRPPLVIIDDLMSTMGYHPKATERFIRQTLLRLHALACEYNTTFLMLRNIPAPGAARTSIDRFQQSPLFYETAQVCLQLSVDPDDPNAHLLSCSRREGFHPPASLRFRVTSDPANSKHALLQWDEAPSVWTGEELYTYARLAPPTALQREILAILAEQSPKPLSAKEISTLLPDEKPDTVSRSIRRMEEKGRIRKHTRGNYELLHPPIKPTSTTEPLTENTKTLSETSLPSGQLPQPPIEPDTALPANADHQHITSPYNPTHISKNVSEKSKHPKNNRKKIELVRSR